ncbi:MAG: AbrB/MazE/SpoVT family DNA-binding domain-containing protein [Pacificimonas sp.]
MPNNLTFDVRVADNGRMVLPMAIRSAIGLKDGGKLVLTLDSDGIHLAPTRQGVEAAQALYRKYARGGRSTADFLRDRREEAIREERGAGDSGVA